MADDELGFGNLIAELNPVDFILGEEIQALEARINTLFDVFYAEIIRHAREGANRNEIIPLVNISYAVALGITCSALKDRGITILPILRYSQVFRDGISEIYGGAFVMIARDVVHSDLTLDCLGFAVPEDRINSLLNTHYLKLEQTQEILIAAGLTIGKLLYNLQIKKVKIPEHYYLMSQIKAFYAS